MGKAANEFAECWRHAITRSDLGLSVDPAGVFEAAATNARPVAVDPAVKPVEEAAPHLDVDSERPGFDCGLRVSLRITHRRQVSSASAHPLTRCPERVFRRRLMR